MVVRVAPFRAVRVASRLSVNRRDRPGIEHPAGPWSPTQWEVENVTCTLLPAHPVSDVEYSEPVVVGDATVCCSGRFACDCDAAPVLDHTVILSVNGSTCVLTPQQADELSYRLEVAAGVEASGEARWAALDLGGC